MSYLNIIIIKLKNPSFRIKMIFVTILFIYSINTEISVLNGFSIGLVGENQINALLFSTHIFSYFAIYADYLLVGLILIIPDILEEPYLTHHFYQHNKNRKKLFKHTILLILSYIMIYLFWFVIITFLVFFLRNGFTSLDWPRELMYKIRTGDFPFLVHIPGDAVSIPLPLVFLIILVKVTLGFLVLCLASFYIAFKKNNMGYGIVLAIVAYFISDLLYFYGDVIPWHIAIINGKNVTFSFIVNKFTLATFFTYEKVNEQFIPRLIETFSYELILITILLYLINKLMKNKDLG